MINFSRFFLIFEDFETVSKLFLDPKHKDKSWWDLQKDFEDSGGKELGQGSYGRVFTHPSWPYVVKMFTNDDPYLKFARYAYKNPHKSFPKFYGAPTKITPEFTREKHMGEIYLSRIEKLKPITNATFEELEHYKTLHNKYRRLTEMEQSSRMFYGNSYDPILIEVINDLQNIPENIKSALEAMSIVDDQMEINDWGTQDWKLNNIMQRDNGDLVLIDPVWEGWDQLAHQREQERQEYDLGGVDYYLDQALQGDGDDIAVNNGPPMVRGGERPKKPKKPKPVKRILNNPPDTGVYSSPF